MEGIGRVSTSNTNTQPVNGTLQNQGDPNDLFKVRLVFSPGELGLRGNPPARVELTEQQVESKLFRQYGFDPKDKVQMAMLKLRFGNEKSPFANINWESHKFVATRNARGQYEITLGVRKQTLEALEGRLIATPNDKTAGNSDPNDAVAARTGFDRANLRKQQLQRLPAPDLTGLTPEQKELVADLGQVGLSIVGIFDPTGIADGADALISLGRGDYWGAGISALGIIPYIGDLAKVGKLPKLLEIVGKVVNMAKADARFAKVVEPLLQGLKKALDNLPINKLPNWAKEPLEKLSTKVDEFFGIRKITKPALTPGGQKAVTLDTLEHIFHGEINKKGKAVGFHYEGVDNMQAVNKTRTTTVTKSPDARGIYEAEVEVQGVAKKARSTFFPKNWTKNDVVNAINEAYTNKKLVPGTTNLYEGVSASGVKVRMYLKPDGVISTAFPVYGK